MATFQNTVTIARPADEVFTFLADFGNIPAWNYAIAHTVQTSPGQAGVGATYRQTRTIPRSRDESFEVTDFAPSRRLAVRGQIGPFNASSSYLLQPTPDGTRLTNPGGRRAHSVARRGGWQSSGARRTAGRLWQARHRGESSHLGAAHDPPGACLCCPGLRSAR